MIKGTYGGATDVLSDAYPAEKTIAKSEVYQENK